MRFPRRSRRLRRAHRSSSATYSIFEPRMLLAADVVYNPVNSLILITGTSAPDEIYISLITNQITVDVVGGSVYQFDQSIVEGIDFEGYGGDDILINDTGVPLTAFGFAGDDFIQGGSAADYIHGGPGNDTLNGMGGADFLNGHEGADLIYGGSDNDYILGGFGDDIIYGEGEDDFIAADWGDDLIYGGPGADNIRGFSGNDEIWGGDGDDLLYGQHGIDVVYGEAGADRLRGGPDGDFLYGGDQDDYLRGDQGDDEHYGGEGNDLILGFTGNDYLDGGPGDDNLQGQFDNDWLVGGEGNDILRGHEGDDYADGGPGNDYSRLDDGNDVFYGGDGDDLAIGGAGDDQLYGGAGADELRGDGGNDTLHGNLGSDLLDGGTGHDVLFGGLDLDDQLTGGTGDDRFLARPTDTVHDANDLLDAVLVFVDETDLWTEAEVANLDVGFAKLASTPAGNRLLQDSVDSGDLTFYKYATLGSAAGTNYLSWSWSNGVYTFHREIRIADWDETNAFANGQFQDVVMHEIGHNWDSELELSQAAPGLEIYWSSFLTLSGWTDTNPNSGSYTLSGDGQWWYLTSASFFENYGRTNPYEDFSTTLEFYFSDGTPGDSQLQAKWDLLDDLFAALGSA